jgi:hypothetical protein
MLKAEHSKFSPPGLSFKKKPSPDTQIAAVGVGTNYAQTMPKV